MANVTANVSAGKPKIGGAIFRAPVGTALPTDAATELNAAFQSMGFISEDGLTNANSIESESVKAWGGDVVLTMQTDRPDSFSFTSLESLNPEVLKAFYGDSNVTGTLSAGIAVSVNANDLGAYSWVVDMLLRDGAIKRIVIPNGRVSETGDVVYKDDTPIGYALTITAMPDSSGNSHYEYIQRRTTSQNTETETEGNG